jgi:site-specific DNA-methyltransferase (adenine-specific)
MGVGMIKLVHGDCLERMKELASNSVDAVVTDPPYGIGFMGKQWDKGVPSVDIWSECLRVLKPGGYLLAFAGTRTQHRMAVRIEDAGFEIRDMIAWVYGSGFPKSHNLKDEWQGWGTALKPALEPITVARKPLAEKTVAENCLKWGTGGINIDGCRVEGNWGGSPKRTNSPESKQVYGDYGKIESEQSTLGRFPANLIHDGSDEVVSLFPNTKSTQTQFKVKGRSGGILGKEGADRDYMGGFNDSGSASRFFYCAKASKSERNRGCEGLEVKQTTGGGGMNNTEDDVCGKYGSIKAPANNNHPTVKPVALMEYLINMVSRDGATILDPFMGSGTTGVACKNLGRNFIGIELDADYIEIAMARIGAADICSANAKGAQ